MGHSFLTFKSHKPFPRCIQQRASKQAGSLSSDRDLQGHANYKMTKEWTGENLNTLLPDSRCWLSGTKTNHQITHVYHVLAAPRVTKACALVQNIVSGSNSTLLATHCCQRSHVTFLSFSFPFYEIREIAYLTAKSKVLYLGSHGTQN